MAAATNTQHRATDHELDLIADLVCRFRPGWDRPLVRYILNDCTEVAAPDLAVAAIRYAADPRFDTPKGIKWRGPHWRDLDTQPVEVTIATQKCDTCGRPEHLCVTVRPGRDDDHVFAPAQRVAR